MQQMSFEILNYPADSGGCGHYRMMFPAWALRTMRKDIRFIESFKYIDNPNFYRGLRIIRLQRQVNDVQANFFLNFLVPVSKSQGQWLIYEIDDVIHYDDIPKYNMAQSAFNNSKFFENVQSMLQATDIITVTTSNLKNYYHKKYDIDLDKIVVIPNYLPRWWIGETYNLERQCKLYKDNIKKPRIGFPLSSSHFDLKMQNNGIDDFSDIVDFVRSTVSQYQWVFKGHVPYQLQDLAHDKKIEVVPPSDLLNYPRELWRHNLQLTIAPLRDNVFNRCKSNIKLLESWALGIPCVAQKLDPYEKYTDRVFVTPDELQNQIDSILVTKQKYKSEIAKNRNVIDYGDENAPYGWWIEKNMRNWLALQTIPQKTLSFDLEQVKSFLNKKEEGLQLNLG